MSYERCAIALGLHVSSSPINIMFSSVKACAYVARFSFLQKLREICNEVNRKEDYIHSVLYHGVENLYSAEK